MLKNNFTENINNSKRQNKNLEKRIFFTAAILTIHSIAYQRFKVLQNIQKQRKVW